MTLAALAFVLARLVLPRRESPHAAPREANLAALRAARAELDRDRALGLLAEDQYEAAREELVRRAAEELDEYPAVPAARPAWITAAVAAVAIPVAAFAFYGAIGSPDALEGAQAFATADGPLTPERLPAYREQLARHVASHPDDARAWALLGRVSLALDLFPQAEAAFGQAVRGRKVALDPGIWCDFADAAGLAQGGRLEGKPAEHIARALSLDGRHPRALEMAGSLAVERRDYAGAARHWRELLALMPDGVPERSQLARAVEKAERMSLAAPRS